MAELPSLPLDENGKPMRIISASAEELVPTQQYANVRLGPVTIWQAVSQDADIEEEIAKLQATVQERVGTERRLLQWALDPSTKVQPPPG